MSKFTDKLMAFGVWAGNNKYLGSIRDAFQDYMPLTIIGAIGTLWTYVIVDGKTGLGALIPAVQKLAFLNPLFNALNFACIGCITVGITFAIGYQIGKRNNQNAFYAGMFAVVALLMITNYTINPGTASVTLKDGTSVLVNDLLPKGAAASTIRAIASGNLGATGMFTGMLVAIFSVEMLNYFSKFDQLKIKLPDSVPPNIAESFNALIPSTLSLLVTGGIAFGLQALTGSYLNDLIYTIIQVPLQHVGDSFAGGLIFVLVISLFWCVGLHGNNMTSAVTQPLFTALLLENEAAVKAGKAATHIVNFSFWSCFVTICGTGIALGITLAILIAGKRDDNRAIAKISLLPNIFNINETVVFGVPVVLNPPMCVGFVLAPLASYIIAYALTAIGFCPVMYINIPWTTPIFISGFLAAGGSIRAGITQLICVAAATLIYIPCVKVYEKQQNLNDEKAKEEEK